MKAVLTIVEKELTRVFTDKKLIFTTFILPALSLILIYSLMGVLIEQMMSDRAAHVGHVAVINAPESFLNYVKADKDANLVFEWRLEASEAKLKDAIYKGELEAMIVFDRDFDQAVAQYQSHSKAPNLRTYYNPSEDYSKEVNGRLETKLLSGYETALLGKRFGSTAYLKAFTINVGNEQSQLAPPEKMSGDILGGLVPMLLSIFLFSGAMGMGIDLITGEKERGTMATLLVTPIKREAIAFGKMISLAIMALVSTASSLFGMAVSFPIMMKAFDSEPSSASGHMGVFVIAPMGMLQFVILSILLTLIYVGLVCLISVYANSIKEAGTLMTPVSMAVMLLGVSTLFSAGTPKAWVYATPIYGTLTAMKEALSAELSWSMFGLNASICLVLTLVIIWGIRQMFNSEKVMFGA